jgi:hypothetical protein
MGVAARATMLKDVPVALYFLYLLSLLGIALVALMFAADPALSSARLDAGGVMAAIER